MELKATLEERISKKSGKPYKCLVIRLTENIEKIVFLKDAEIELLTLKYSK